MNGERQRRIIHATKDGWEDVPIEGYRHDDHSSELSQRLGVSRHTILGSRKQTADQPGPSLEVRYFELQPGAVSRLEKHSHEHFVIVKRGLGYAVIENDATEIAANDVIYVAPNELHQFVNRGNQPFGFYCIVDAVRDFPQEPDDSDIARLSGTAAHIAKPFAVPLAKKSG